MTKIVVQLVLDDDLAPMHHVIFVDDVNVPLVHELESRQHRDDGGVMQLSVDQDGAGLTVSQQAVRVRKIRPEGDVRGLAVESGIDRTDLTGLRKLVVVRQLEFDFLLLLMLLPGGHVFEVSFLGYVEICPHHAVIGQGREGVALLDQAPFPLVQAIDDAVEWCFDAAKVQFGLRQLLLALALSSLAWSSATSF